MKIRSRALPLALIIFLGLIYLFAWSPVFEVRSISISGIPSNISEKTIISKSGVLVGEKLSRIEPRSVEHAMSELSWVKDVSVNRNWISGKVGIDLAIRTAIGIYKGKAIDKSGTLFEIPGDTPKGLPMVSASSPALGLAAIALFTDLPLEVQEKTLSVSATGESAISSWQLVGPRQVKVMWGSSDQIDLKVTVFKALLALPENKAIKRVDLSAPHAPIVK